MLQALRNQASSWLIKILLGLLILSFAIWGINDVFLGERDPVIVSVGDIQMTRSQVNDEIRDEMNRLQPLFGGRLNRAEADRMGITDQVVENLVNRAAVNQGAADLGIVISDRMVARRIQSDPAFRNSRGEFDRNVFAQVLSRAGMNEGFYVANLKRDLTTAFVNRAIGAAVTVPAAVIDPLVRFRAERRIAKSALVPTVPESTVSEPTDSEIQAYYKANSQAFMTPPLRDVSWIHLNPEVMSAEIQVGADRLKQAYEDRKEEFTTRDRRELDQVVFRTESAAAEAAKQVAAGKTLAEAATAVDKSLKPVSLGWIERKDMLPDLAEAVFALKKGEISKPLKSALGWHIIAVKDAEVGRVRPFDDVKDQIRKDIATREATDAILSLTNKLEDALAAGASLDEAARQVNLQARRAEALDARGNDATGATVENLPKGGAFLRTAFETAEGQDSALTEAQGGGFFILRVNKVTPPQLQPLDAVRDEVVKAARAEARAKATEARANAILKKIASGTSIDAAAKAEKLTVKTSPPFTRLTHDAESGLPAALMDRMFSLKPGEGAVAQGNDGFVVGVLTEVTAPSEKEKTETANSLRDEMRQGLTGDLFQQFVASLRGRYDVSVRTGLLQERQ
ncbi:MAG: peptidyl-prolyl cis-trans isomerase [Alphaproteobacteria bacterium]